MLAHYGRKKDRDASTASDPFAFAGSSGHRGQFEAMAGAIRDDDAPPNSIETTRHTIAVLEAIYESGRTGRPVRVAD